MRMTGDYHDPRAKIQHNPSPCPLRRPDAGAGARNREWGGGNMRRPGRNRQKPLFLAKSRPKAGFSFLPQITHTKGADRLCDKSLFVWSAA
jgi:hypothetical protein